MKAYTYITANTKDGVLYTGVTSELKHRMRSHKTIKYKKAFTARYNADKLVWNEEFDRIVDAMVQARRNALEKIEGMNPGWGDLTDGL